MKSFVTLLQSAKDFRFVGGVSRNAVEQAENVLGVRFSNEYSDYLRACGAALIRGHEFTGICESARLNVVSVTQDERSRNDSIPKDWYVIEQGNINGIVLWQTGNGEVYQTAPNCTPMRISPSLAKYIGESDLSTGCLKG